MAGSGTSHDGPSDTKETRILLAFVVGVLVVVVALFVITGMILTRIFG